MTAVNKPVVHQIYSRIGAPLIVELPVQAGSSQALKIGEICKLRDPSDLATYPIIPATANDTGYIPLIVAQEQKATDAARLLQFILPTADVAFKFALNTATAVKMGDKIAIHDSQTVKVSSSNNVAAAVAYPLADGSFQSVTECLVVFGLARAEAVKHFPFAGCAVAGTVAGLDDMDDVGTLAYTAGKILVGDGDSYEEVAVSGDATLAANGALTLAAAAKGVGNAISDPGTGQAIPVTASGNVPLTIADAAQTNTLAVPTFKGQMLLIAADTVAGSGSRTITIANIIDGTNETALFDAAGEMLLLVGVKVGATFAWRKVAHVGCTLSHV